MSSGQALHVEVHYEGDGYWAQVREWPGCFATGDTFDELTEALEDAIGLWMTPSGEEAEEQPGEGEDLSQYEDLGDESYVRDIDPADLEGEVEPVRVRLHILEMELTVAAEVPLVPARWEDTARQVPPPPRRRDAHYRWHLRGFHRRGEQ